MFQKCEQKWTRKFLSLLLFFMALGLFFREIEIPLFIYLFSVHLPQEGIHHQLLLPQEDQDLHYPGAIPNKKFAVEKVQFLQPPRQKMWTKKPIKILEWYVI